MLNQTNLRESVTIRDNDGMQLPKASLRAWMLTNIIVPSQLKEREAFLVNGSVLAQAN